MSYFSYWKNNTKKLLIQIVGWFLLVFLFAILPLLGLASLVLFTEFILVPSIGRIISFIIFLIIVLSSIGLVCFLLSYSEYKIKQNKGGNIGKKR